MSGHLEIPTTSSWVRLDELHPQFKFRLGALLDSSECKGKVAVVSGVRTFAAQEALYKKYKSGRGNLAANPNRKFGGGFQGSWHMAQPALDNYGFAVDFRIVSKGISTWEVNNLAKQYGIYPTVKSEWWHHQPYGRKSDGTWGWFDAPALRGEASEHKEPIIISKPHPLQVLKEGSDKARRQVLRLRSRGEAVKFLQLFLEQQNIPCARNGKRTLKGAGIDGIFGRGTLRAVKQFQKDSGLTVDGIVGPATWKELIDG